jgi:NADPH:quinone reductase-like Zn-dependent oxidoreductase
VYSSSELGPYYQNPFLALITPLFRGKWVKFPIPLRASKSHAHIKTLIERGQFKPVIDRTYALGQVREAFDYVKTGEKIGNVVLEIA